MLLYSNLVSIFIYINQAMRASSRKETHINTESKDNIYGLKKKSVAQKCIADRQTEHGNIKYVNNIIRKFMPTTFLVPGLLLVRFLTA